MLTRVVGWLVVLIGLCLAGVGAIALQDGEVAVTVFGFGSAAVLGVAAWLLVGRPDAARPHRSSRRTGDFHGTPDGAAAPEWPGSVPPADWSPSPDPSWSRDDGWSRDGPGAIGPAGG